MNDNLKKDGEEHYEYLLVVLTLTLALIVTLIPALVVRVQLLSRQQQPTYLGEQCWALLSTVFFFYDRKKSINTIILAVRKTRLSKLQCPSCSTSRYYILFRFFLSNTNT